MWPCSRTCTCPSRIPSSCHHLHNLVGDVPRGERLAVVPSVEVVRLVPRLRPEQSGELACVIPFHREGLLHAAHQVEPHRITVRSAFFGPQTSGRGVSFRNPSSLRIRFSCIFRRSSTNSGRPERTSEISSPLSICSSVAPMNWNPFVPGNARGLTPLSVIWYRRKSFAGPRGRRRSAPRSPYVRPSPR